MAGKTYKLPDIATFYHHLASDDGYERQRLGGKWTPAKCCHSFGCSWQVCQLLQPLSSPSFGSSFLDNLVGKIVKLGTSWVSCTEKWTFTFIKALSSVIHYSGFGCYRIQTDFGPTWFGIHQWTFDLGWARAQSLTSNSSSLTRTRSASHPLCS